VIVLPTNISCFQSKTGKDKDVWSIWADFRTMCGNHFSKLTACLRLTEVIYIVEYILQFSKISLTQDIDDEFVEPTFVMRWNSEPVSF
jgi:hypothetical protein